MKQRAHAVTASILIAGGSVAALPAAAEGADPVMIVNRSAAQAPEASLVRKNLAAMGREPPATTLARGAGD
jgi:hypothetical protein